MNTLGQWQELRLHTDKAARKASKPCTSLHVVAAFCAKVKEWTKNLQVRGGCFQVCGSESAVRESISTTSTRKVQLDAAREGLAL